ncbi:Inner membrane ABC transporter permease protein ydcV [Cedecea lapagei]|uniref:Inner membrane ABC transporter permease protein ydcV n=1 Tax=Cedecea lapagei TaxID=158823 RepID=A0A3S4JBL0_9ENTR|nr:ABC transporter permease subunit [Cedecea lapagei]VEB97490.1 Inner membrane ABC transporter permease protein ydcV [Cedecea lapagei]
MRRLKGRLGLPLQALLLAFMLFAMFGPLLNLLIWTVAESWFYPHALPSQWGLKYWYQVFSPYSDVSGSLLTSVFIAVLSVLVCLIISIPAGYALSRRAMPLRVMFMLLFLLPQAFPNLTVYMNIARLFYQWGLNGTVAGVVLVHSVHGLMYSIWICVAAFSAIDPLQARASRNLGAGPLLTFWYIVLPQASPGIMAAGIFVFLESLDEFTGTFFVGAPDITTLPLLLYNASMSGNYQVSSITALILLVPSLLFMLVIHKCMRPEMLSKMGK